MPSPTIISLDTAGRALRDFVPTYFDVLGREFDRAWTDFKDGFPNPVAMGFATLNFFTTAPFIPLYAFVENFGRAMVKDAEYYRRFVITGYDAFKLTTEITTKASLKAGLIDTSFIDQIIIWISSRVFTMVSGGGFISRIVRLVGVSSYDDVLTIFKNSAMKALFLQLARWFMVWFAVGYAMITMVFVGVYWNDLFEGLQQNNPRKKGVQRNRVKA